MVIKDGTLVAFPNKDMGIVVGSPFMNEERDLRQDPILSSEVCEVQILFPHGEQNRPMVAVSSLTPIGQTKGEDAINSAYVEELIAMAEKEGIDAMDPVI